MAGSYVADRALELLQAAQAGLAEARTSNPVPSRVYRSIGPPAVDVCDDDGLLVVYLEPRGSIRNHAAPDRPPYPSTREVAPVIHLVLEWWRCVPNLTEDGSPEDAATYDAATADLLRDAWSLEDYVLRAHFAGDLFDAEVCAGAVFGELAIISPSGNAAGGRWPVQLAAVDTTAFP